MNSVESYVIDMIGEDSSSPDVFTDTDTGLAQIRDSINDAIEELSMITGSYKETFHISLVTNKRIYYTNIQPNHYSWVTDCILLNSKSRLTQKTLSQLALMDNDFLRRIGKPIHYVQIGLDKLMLWPNPQSNDLLELTCIMIPKRYASSTERLKIQEQFRQAVVHFAVGEFWASRGNADLALSHHNEYLERAGIQRLSKRDVGYSPSLRSDKVSWDTTQQ